MSVAMQFNTANQTLRQLLGNGLTYRVPSFQRDYSWDADEWEALWADLTAMREPNGEQGHYMGYLVLQSRDIKKFEVIDGQQRLTTLSLLFLGCIAILEDMVKAGVDPADNLRRAAALRDTYIGFLDPVTLTPASKLRLNRANDRYFQTYLVPLEKPPARGQVSSNRLLSRAYHWLLKQLRALLQDKSGADVAQFAGDVADRLFFTVITVSDELNAFKVFETLNARGVRLSSTDLLKNYLFALVHKAGADESRLAVLEGIWQAILEALGDHSFPDYLRIWWNGRHKKLVRQNDLFREVRASVRDEKDVFALLRSLERAVGVYVALGQPEDRAWTPDQRRGLELLKMFNVRQPWMLLLVGHECLDASEFSKVVMACAVSSFRYNVIGHLNPQEQETIYHEEAFRLYSGECADSRGVRDALTKLGPTDAQFEAAFADAELRTTSPRNKRIARYICAELEKHVFGPGLDADDGGCTLEHILPERADPAEWPSVTYDPADSWCYRIGNYTLLEASKNTKAGNRDWQAKRRIFAQSSVKTTVSVAERYPEQWGPVSIQRRQAYLAQRAREVWTLP